MNITFTKVRYKNLLSYGDVFTEVDLDRKGTTLISGTNGTGKSTMVEALSFALYGKPHRKVTKPELVNSINNKGLLVEVEFTAGETQYLVRRGMKPNIFEIWKNGEMLDQNAATRDYQLYFENNILRINHKSFCQIVVLGKANYTPFMDLTPANRREVIEDLLDIGVFSTMNLLLKDKISENKNLVAENKIMVDSVKNKLESAIEHNESLTELKKLEAGKIKEKIKEQLELIESEKSNIEQTEEDIAQHIALISDKAQQKDKYDKSKTVRNDLANMARSLERDLSFYSEHDNCPTCKQGIEENFKNLTIQEKKAKLDDVQSGISKIEKMISDLERRLDEISKVEDQIQKCNLRIGESRAKINLSMGILKGYKKDLENAVQSIDEVDETKVNELKSQLVVLQKEQQDLYDHRETLGVVSVMLKDGGIKTQIIKQYMPIINQLINKYLAKFNLFVDFHLDENFNEVIKSRHRDKFTFSLFSEGEKMRITLAIMLAWRAVAKLRNSVSTNIVFFDETLDGSLDEMGIADLIEHIHNLNVNDSVFVISHRGDAISDRFSQHIRTRKEKNFSVLEHVN